MKILTAIFAIAILCSSTPRLFAQGGGSLAPPGAPAPTMKTLQEIEPRTPLIEGAADAAAVSTSDAEAHFIINQTGSYYLTANLNATKINGIIVRAVGVTLDLNGFTVAKVGGPEGAGVSIAGDSDQCTVKNGMITGFGAGLEVGISGAVRGTARDILVHGSAFAGISIFSGFWNVDGCHADANGSEGINARFSRVTDCIASSNGNFGIKASVITNCYAVGNEIGISGDTISGCHSGSNRGVGIRGSTVSGCDAVDNGTTGTEGLNVTACHVSNNGGIGIDVLTTGAAALNGCSASRNGSSGFRTRLGTMISHCSSVRNQGLGFQILAGSRVADCTATDNESDGYFLSEGSTVEGCTAKDNKGDGIRATTRCLILNNLSDGNTGFGIHTIDIRNRIDGNQVTGNDVGIKVDAATNLIIRNTATGNTPNWQIAANNNVGAIVVPTNSPAINGNTGGSGVNTTDPWANFSY